MLGLLGLVLIVMSLNEGSLWHLSLVNYGANDQPGVEVEHQPATKHVVFFWNVGLSCNYVLTVLTQWLVVEMRFFWFLSQANWDWLGIFPEIDPWHATKLPTLHYQIKTTKFPDVFLLVYSDLKLIPFNMCMLLSKTPVTWNLHPVLVVVFFFNPGKRVVPTWACQSNPGQPQRKDKNRPRTVSWSDN